MGSKLLPIGVFHPDQGGKTAGLMRRPVRKKQMRVAAGTNAGGMHVTIRKTGHDQLMPAYLPEVKMVRAHAKGPQMRRDLVPIIDELGTAWPQRRPDGGHHPFWLTTKADNHLTDGSTNNVGHTAPPAAMDVGHHPPLRLEKHDRLTICRLDQQPNPRHIGNQRIGCCRYRLNRIAAVFNVSCDDPDRWAVVLMGINMDPTPTELPQPFPVEHDRFGYIPYTRAQIQTVIGREAKPAVTAGDGMEKPIESVQRGELKKRNA